MKWTDAKQCLETNNDFGRKTDITGITFDKANCELACTNALKGDCSSYAFTASSCTLYSLDCPTSTAGSAGE